jgi:hypothetical protein
LRFAVKAELLSEEELDKELEIAAEFVAQVYRTIHDYCQNQYPTYKYKQEKQIYPLIVTLGEWYLFGPKVLPLLEEKVQEHVKKAGLQCRG